MAPTEGSVLGGDFKLLRPLSAGGMGSVFVAEQQSTGSQRALKLMHPDLVTDPKLRARFETEAKVASSIASDHVVQVLVAGVDSAEDTPFLVMELLEGETLKESVDRRGPVPAAEVAELAEQLFHALIAAHDVRIVHRDLKPENVFLAKARSAGARFTLKVLDFGIAKLLANVKSARTQAMGTPLWMAPEQTEVESVVTPATDVWALGLLMFYVLTGKSYWRSADASTSEVLREVLEAPLVPASERALELGVASPLPAGFDAVFARAVTRDPAQRYADAAPMYAELSAVLGPVTSRTSKTSKSSSEPKSSGEPKPSSGPKSAGATKTSKASKTSKSGPVSRRRGQGAGTGATAGVARTVVGPSQATLVGGPVHIAAPPVKPKAPESSILPYAVLGLLLASGAIAGLSRVIAERTPATSSASSSSAAAAPPGSAASPGGKPSAVSTVAARPRPTMVPTASAPPRPSVIPPELAPPPPKPAPKPGDPILDPSKTGAAPATFKIKFDTTEGAVDVECFRDWSPNGADRLHQLVKIGFYDDVAIFRVVTQPKPFVVQFGMAGDPAIGKVWSTASINDDPAKESNARGTLTFAKKGNPNSRTTQVFINLADNKNLDAMGFTPVCRVLGDGMTVVDRIHSEYQGSPDQGQITAKGNAYLRESFPLLDYVRSARLMKP